MRKLPTHKVALDCDVVTSKGALLDGSLQGMAVMRVRLECRNAHRRAVQHKVPGGIVVCVHSAAQAQLGAKVDARDVAAACDGQAGA